LEGNRIPEKELLNITETENNDNIYFSNYRLCLSGTLFYLKYRLQHLNNSVSDSKNTFRLC